MHCECMIEGGVLNTLDIPHDYWHHLIVCYCDISLNAYLGRLVVEARCDGCLGQVFSRQLI